MDNSDVLPFKSIESLTPNLHLNRIIETVSDVLEL